MDNEEKEKNHFKTIENDLMQGLLNAEIPSSSRQNDFVNDVPDKLKLNVPNLVVKLVCDVKNSIKVKYITKDMDDSDKEIVIDFLRTTDKEIQLYKMVLEEAGTNLTPENYKEILNKWLCSSYLLLIEFEVESLLKVRSLLKNSNIKKEKAA